MNVNCQSVSVVLFLATLLPAAEPNRDRESGRTANSAAAVASETDRGKYDLFYELLNGSDPPRPGFAEQAEVPFAEDADRAPDQDSDQDSDHRADGSTADQQGPAEPAEIVPVVASSGLVSHGESPPQVTPVSAEPAAIPSPARVAQNSDGLQRLPRKIGTPSANPQPSYLPNLKPLRASGTAKPSPPVAADVTGQGNLPPLRPRTTTQPVVEKLPPPLINQTPPQSTPLEIVPLAQSRAFGAGDQVDPDAWLRQKIQACAWNANETQIRKWCRNQRRNRQLFGGGILGGCGVDGCQPAGQPTALGSSSWVAPWSHFTSTAHRGGPTSAAGSCRSLPGRRGGNACYDPACSCEANEFRHGWLLSRRPEQLRLGGWVAISGNRNLTDPQTVPFNGPLTFVDQANDFQMNQLYMYLERPVRKHGFSIGGRLDLLYGTDARFSLASGLDDKITLDRTSPDLKLAIPQVYAEVGLGSMSVKLGHFYTILGYEVVAAPDNFFITHSYSMQYAEPFTHTGVLAKMSLSEQLSVQAGVTRGWDNWSDNNNDLDVLAGINWVNRCRDFSLSGSVTSGAQDDAGINNRTVGTVLMGMQLTDRIAYLLQTDLGYEENATASGQDAEWYGVVNYLTLTLNDFVTIGTRYEWFSDDDGVRVAGLGAPQGSSVLPNPAHWQQAALGVIVQPTDNILVRNELRWDWVTAIDGADYRPFDDFSSRSQALWATDIIVGF